MYFSSHIPLKKHFLLTGLFLTLCSCHASVRMSDEALTEADFLRAVEDTILITKETISVCGEAFKTHQDALSETTVVSSESMNLLVIVEKCRHTSHLLRERINPLRSGARFFFGEQKKLISQLKEDSRQTEIKEKLNHVIRNYASLIASIRIGSEEAQIFLTPLQVHSKYISEQGLPENKDLIEEEKKYVDKVYKIFEEELSITLNESKRLNETLMSF